MKSHGEGNYEVSDFGAIGRGVVIETGVMVFHANNIVLGDDIYIGHQTILKGYHNSKLRIDSGTWIGQQCFIHSAGNIVIGKNVGIGPGVKIFSSLHDKEDPQKPILHSRLLFKPVTIESNSDIGIGSVIMPGVHIGEGVQIGAGSVVTKSVKAFSIVAGVPAKYIGSRK